MVYYDNSNTAQDVAQIIALQTENLPKNISKEEAIEQGFVTVIHTPELLQKMGAAHPHTIAFDGEQVVGYALTMLRDFRNEIPVLRPMFDRIDGLSWNNKPLRDCRYLVMGQVCIHKAYRGQGVFRGLYQQMRAAMQLPFEIVVTEIAKRNTRSIRAHEKVGFVPLQEYASDGEDWVIVAWDWS